MTLSQSQTRILRVCAEIILVLLAWYGLSQAIHWLLVGSIAILATHVILQRTNPLLYWPVGLLVVIVSAYIGYWVQWLGEPVGVDRGKATLTFYLLILFFGTVAIFRSVRNTHQIQIANLSRVLTVLLMNALPIVLIVLVSQRWGDNPARIISGHLGGGDHGPHNEIVHRLLKESGEVTFVSPLQMYAYPQAVHYFIANLVMVAKPSSHLPLLGQEYAMGAWFEWLQFAAFCQMALVVFMKGASGSGLRRALMIAPLIFVFSTMDNFVAQLFWAGFTTSLAVTWILMTFIAIADHLKFDNGIKENVVSLLVILFFAYASWVSYQPYAVIFLCLLLLTIVRALDARARFPWFIIATKFLERPLVQIFFVIFGLWVFLLVVLGKESPAVTSLMLDGATHKPHLYTVLLWAFLAMCLVWNRLPTGGRHGILTAQFQFIHFGFVVGMALVVVLAGNFDMWNLPYYIQKMLWILMFVSIPVALASGFTWIEELQSQTQFSRRLGVSLCIAIALLFTPLVQGRLPISSTKKPTVDWFAKSIVADKKIDSVDAVAFSPLDPLGSHLANLALRATSNVFLPVDTSLKGNAYLTCRFINREPVATVYTSEGGISAMANGGCKLNNRFVVDGEVQQLPEVPYSDLAFDIEYRVGKSDIAQFTLLRGFNSVENWGAWATGYLSAIAIKIPKSTDEAGLTIRIRPSKSGPDDPTVRFFVDNQQVSEIQFFDNTSREIRLPLGQRTKGEKFEIGIDCAWTDDDAATIAGDIKPKNCLGVESIKLTSKS